jgi:PAS domain S-box-containing protein
MFASAQQQDYLETAVAAVRDAPNRPDWRSALDKLPVPVYTTDGDGLVTHWNRACVEFAGRDPQLGQDRWCVTWQLYTMAGEPLAHEDCPMAEAIKSRKAVRGKIAIVMRPDGSRRAFTPYPTPVLDSSGELSGAVNMLIDVTDEQAQALADQAARCERLARATNDGQASGILADMARHYACTAATLRAAP